MADAGVNQVKGSRSSSGKRPLLKEVTGLGAGQPIELDRVIHERVRLSLISSLAAAGTTSFTDLKTSLGITDGNLSVHARKLEEAGYISCRKSFNGRIPKTEFDITEAGRAALNRYLDHMEALIRAVQGKPSGRTGEDKKPRS